MFYVFVKLPSGKNMTISVVASNSIAFIMAELHEIESIPTKEQRLTFEGTELKDSCTLADYSIKKDGVAHVLLCICLVE